MATKTFKVSLSLDNPRIIQSGIKVRSFDKQSIKISIELTKNSQVYQIPTGAQIKISLLKLARQEQKIILDVPFTSADSIDWVVPDYLDGYQGEVRVGIYLIVGTENIDVGYFNITSSVSDIDSAAEEFTESVLQGWAIEDLTALLPQFQAVLDETTGKDVVSAPEIILARGGAQTLGERLEEDKAEVTAQLAQKAPQLELDVEKARIDNLIATAGDGTVPSELIDIRVGANATTYPTAGKSIRDQFININNSLSEVKDLISSGTNKFDKEKVTDGYFVNSTSGKLNASPTYYTSDFCEISPSQHYTIFRVRLYAFYDVNKNFISGVDIGSNTISTVIAPEKARYIRFSFYKANGLENMLVEGTELPETYVPFNLKIEKLSVYENNVENGAITAEKLAAGSVSENSMGIDAPYYFKATQNPLLYGVDKLLYNPWEVGSIYYSNGFNEVSSKVVRSPNYIRPSDTIKVLLLSDNYKVDYRIYDQNKNYIGGKGYSVGDIEIPYSEGYFYKFLIAKTDNTDIVSDDIVDIDKNVVIGQGTSNLFNLNAIPDKMKNDLSLVKMDTILGTGKKYVAVYGRMGYAPYNTLEAIKMAKHAGAWGVEIDLRLTADGDVVLFHEEKIHETTNEADQKFVYEYTVQELKQFNFVGGAAIYYTHDIKIPTLDEVLVLCKELNLVPMLDMKNDGGSYENANQNIYIDTVISKLKNHGMLGQCVLISSYQTSLSYMRSKAPYTWLAVKSLLKYGATAESGIAIAKAVGGNIIMQPEDGGMPELITDELLTKYHEAGYLSKYSDFIHTITPDNPYKNSIRYFAQISSADGGNTWSVGDKSANQQVTVQKIKVGTYDALSIAFDDLEYWDVRHLRASIYADGNTDPLLIIKSGTDGVSKSIVVLFNYNNSVGVFGQLPTNTEFRLNIVF